MKKIHMIVALAMVLVLAFAGTAFAAGQEPANRSSSFLAKGEAYVSWSKAQTQMTDAGVSAEDKASVHGNYTTTTVKCQVCHSAHKASITGDTLLQSTAAQACVPCHLGATATSDLKVSAGNRHGSATGCTNGYCHAVAPHGAGDISKYATLKTAMLTENADSLLDAAIASGVNGAPAQGNIFSVPYGAVIATMTVNNPAVTAALLNDVTTADAKALGRAVGTGYVCANGGCHINGQFNSLTENASWGAWGGDLVTDQDAIPGQPFGFGTYTGPVYIPAGTYAMGSTVTSEGVTYDVWDVFQMRKTAIKGHTLATVADLAVRDVAYANVGACKACHDSIDYRISATTKQFPHGNDRIDTDGTKLAGKTNAWFTVGAYLGSADATLTTRATGSPLTSASDGACLKCHRGAADNGVGFDY